MAVAVLAFAGSAAAAPPEEKITIEGLLKAGWEIAGFAGNNTNRSALVLFKHPTEQYLVQCLTGYDVTRTPRVYAHCYELR